MSFEISITPEMKRQFVSEVSEHLDNFEKMLMVLEKEPSNHEAIHSALRFIHSIKGNSGYIGIKDIAVLSHELESLMSDLQSRKIAITGDTLSLIFECLDLLKDMNLHIAEEDYKERDTSSVVSRIKSIKTAIKKIPFQPQQQTEIDTGTVFVRASSQHIEYIRETANQILAGELVKGARRNILRILKTFHTSANYAGFTDIVAILRDIEDEVEKAKSIRKNMSEYLLDKIKDIEALIAEIVPSEPVAATPVEKVSKPSTQSDEEIAISETLHSEVISGDIKIEREKINELINQVSELIVAKNNLNHLTRNIIANQTTPEWNTELKDTSSNIDKISNRLHSNIMKLGFGKINLLFERFPRIVRDLSHNSEKKVELSILGGETEIDRKIIEYLIAPLIHLIRNAFDHGIELPVERVRKGKPDHGLITLKAYHEGDYIIIDIIDDGKGLHIDEIKKESLKRGIITEGVLQSMKNEEIMNLIFMPGYTTIQEATLVSGRGIGLDIVKDSINSIGGNVTIFSEPDIGTHVRLQVPFTIAMMDVLLTEVSGEYYAFPLSSIMESVKIERNKIQVLNKREAISYRGNIIGIKYLSEILGMANVENSGEELIIIVITFGGQICGVVVDRILRRESVLAKPLERRFFKIKEFSGTAILGDGSIILILDPMGII